MHPRAWPLAITLIAAAACGARTDLEPGVPARVTFAGCGKPPWLLFDVSTEQPTGFPGIHAIHADGTGHRALDLPHPPALFPSVSPDGSLLYYSGASPTGDPGTRGLYVYDFGSRTTSLVLTTPDLTYTALSPDGRTLAYVSGFSLKAAAPDGTGDRTLLFGPDSNGLGFGHPTFGADPGRVVYAGGGVVGSIGVDGAGNETLLTAMPGSFQYPNAGFSPDHGRIVLGALCAQGSLEALRVYPFASLPGLACEAGEVLARVEPGSSPNQANDPSWGPGDVIAYASGKDVWLVDGNGSGSPTPLTAALTGDAGAIRASDPVWAPGCAELP